MTIGGYAQFCTTVLMNKVIPLLLSMNETMGVMAEKQAETVSVIRGLSEKQDVTISEIRGLSGKQDQTISEIRGLRGDLATQNNIEWQARIEKDISVVKSKMGIR
ncbi:MAG: hypothetical protein A4E49_00379 [Methanosaeta sp. PtaU1.Bin112]|nr:MAG: hypothetical protein A4E49_00379 [Methanosaeta sp. PtaU1.Bin112]